MTDKQGRTAGYRLSRRGLLYRDETGRERLAAVYWLTKLGTKTRWMLGLGVVGFIGLSILVAALDSTEDPLAGLTPEQVVSVQATATQEALTAQEEEARQEEIATQEEQERAYLEALAEQEEQKAEQDEITQQIAALYPEAHPIWVDCVVITHDEGDELVHQELIESCGQPEAWKWFVPLVAEQFPQESSTWIDCAAFTFSNLFSEEELQLYNEDDEYKAQARTTFYTVCDSPTDTLEAVQELKVLLHGALSSVREGCQATSIGNSIIPDSCQLTLDTAVANIRADARQGSPSRCLELLDQRLRVIMVLEELGSVVDAARLGNPDALIFLGITLYSQDADEGGFAALDARITEIEC